MRRISQKIRDKFKPEKCNYCDSPGNERHHALFYQGRQIDEDFAIIPLCTKHHRGNNGTIFKDVKEKCELKAITDGLTVLKERYPRSDWEQRLKYLKQIIAK